MKTMKTKGLFLASLASMLIVFSSCEKNEIVPSGPTFGLDFKTENSGFTLKSAAANNLEFTSGHVILESAEFELESETDSIGMEFEIESFITVDFATGETTPDISSIEIFPGTYEEIELELELFDESDLNSILLDGTWTDDEGNTYPVKLELESGQSFELEMEGNIVIEESTALIAWITFDPNVWFSGVTAEELSSATINEDDEIIINAEHNTHIYEKVKEGLDFASEVEITVK